MEGNALVYPNKTKNWRDTISKCNEWITQRCLSKEITVKGMLSHWLSPNMWRVDRGHGSYWRSLGVVTAVLLWKTVPLRFDLCADVWLQVWYSSNAIHLILWDRFRIGMKVTKMAKLAGQQTPGICLYPPPLSRDHKHLPPCFPLLKTNKKKPIGPTCKESTLLTEGSL